MCYLICLLFRFNYTYYEKKHGPIYKSIEALDRIAMDIIETGDADAFKQYLLEYENTICGRHPISVFLHVSLIYLGVILSLPNNMLNVVKRLPLSTTKGIV